MTRSYRVSKGISGISGIEGAKRTTMMAGMDLQFIRNASRIDTVGQIKARTPLRHRLVRLFKL